MKIALHQMEPWLIEHQNARYNFGESGVLDQTLGELLAVAGEDPARMLEIDLRNPDTRGSPALRATISELYAGSTPEQVLVTTGTSEALFIYYQLRHRPGANVVVPLPSFQTLYELPRAMGYEVRLLRLRREDGFRPDLDELERLVDDRTQTIVVNNPHNPTGVLLTPDELGRILAIAERHGADVLADEHYRFVPYAGRDPIPSLYGASPRVIAVGSMIKCTGCVGLRVGWILGPPSFLAECRDFRDYTTHTLSPLSEYVTQVVLAHWRPIVARYRGFIAANLERFRGLVAEHPDALAWVEPQAGIVAFPWLVGSRWTSERFCRELVDATGVFVLPGEVFEVPGHFRIGFGQPPEAFSTAMGLLSGFLAGFLAGASADA